MDTFRKLLDNGMTEKENENIFPLSKLHKQMPLTFTRHGVNWLLRNKSKNGFDKVLYKCCKNIDLKFLPKLASGTR